MPQPVSLAQGSMVDLLLDRSGLTPAAHGQVLIVHLLQDGYVRYRHDDRVTGPAHAETALGILREDACALRARDRDLLVRLLLLVPWGTVRNQAGLHVDPEDLIRALADSSDQECVIAALRDVLDRGPDAIRKLAREDLLDGCPFLPEGLVFNLGSRSSRFSPLDTLFSLWHPGRWEANARGFVRWWMEASGGTCVREILDRIERQRESRARVSDVKKLSYDEKRRLEDDLALTHALLLGLFDRLLVPYPPGAKNLDPVLADAFLQRGLESGSGPVRAGAVRLAAGLERWDVVEDRAVHDKDAMVRKVSAKVLADAKRFLFPDL